MMKIDAIRLVHYLKEIREDKNNSKNEREYSDLASGSIGGENKTIHIVFRHYQEIFQKKYHELTVITQLLVCIHRPSSLGKKFDRFIYRLENQAHIASQSYIFIFIFTS